MVGVEAPSVVVAGLHDDEFFVGRLVDETMLVGDASGPVAGQVVGQALGLADPCCGIACRSSIIRLIRVRIVRSAVQEV